MKASLPLALGAVLFLAACGKPSQSASDQPSSPSEPATASEPEEHELTDADKKAALADLPARFQTADLDDGQAKFALCKSCHTAVEGAGDMVGPNLHGVFGRKAGTKPGFAYSDAMKAYGVTWDAEQLDKYLRNPRQVVPGTKMTFAGLPDDRARTDLIAYLRIVSSSAKRD